MSTQWLSDWCYALATVSAFALAVSCIYGIWGGDGRFSATALVLIVAFGFSGWLFDEEERLK